MDLRRQCGRIHKDLCSECKGIVTALQEALLCDGCQRWTHRTCGTKMPRETYLELKAGKRKLEKTFPGNVLTVLLCLIHIPTCHQ